VAACRGDSPPAGVAAPEECYLDWAPYRALIGGRILLDFDRGEHLTAAGVQRTHTSDPPTLLMAPSARRSSRNASLQPSSPPVQASAGRRGQDLETQQTVVVVLGEDIGKQLIAVYISDIPAPHGLIHVNIERVDHVVYWNLSVYVVR
jgi:hypothetical protein